MAFGAVQQFPNDTRPDVGIGVNLPFSEGIISPIAFDAPVEVGTIDWPADLALLGSLCELSRLL